MYTIIDIETTGTGIKGNKITEIAIFKHNGSKVVDTFATLVNPQCPIPFFITGLTGIDDGMVKNAPIFSEVADKVLEITRDTIFVAHNVNFDYHVLKNEFREIGMDFTRKKLCTVRLSRKLFPGYRSYSLGKLCSSMSIPLQNRHRAVGDAEATVLLFEKILNNGKAEKTLKEFLNARSQEATLPSGLSKRIFKDLPNVPGVYYFKNAEGKVVYVGKAINIQKRVLGHFYDKSNKEVRLCSETVDIDFEKSGSELVALLMESSAIKHFFPKYNRAQKRNSRQFALFSYEDRNGIIHLATNKSKMVPKTLMVFNTLTEARTYMERLCERFGLCPKFCHLQDPVIHCSHFRLPCHGICRGEESVEQYNQRVVSAIGFMLDSKTDFIIKEKGRTPEEEAFVLVQDDTYRGYGFVDKESCIQGWEDLESHLIPKKNTPEARSILRWYLNKYPTKVTPLSNQSINWT
ncbi:MAG: exonuclease domain-containing protein [Flavobacteriaceae bacterium]